MITPPNPPVNVILEHPPFVQTVERDNVSVIERRTELLGVFPTDPITQRAWAIDRAQTGLSGTISQPTVDEILQRADSILDYVLGRAEEA